MHEEESSDLFKPSSFRSGKDPQALPPLSPDEARRLGREPRER